MLVPTLSGDPIALRDIACEVRKLHVVMRVRAALRQWRYVVQART